MTSRWMPTEGERCTDRHGDKWKIVRVPAFQRIPRVFDTFQVAVSMHRPSFKEYMDHYRFRPLDEIFSPPDATEDYDLLCIVPDTEPTYNEWGEEGP